MGRYKKGIGILLLIVLIIPIIILSFPMTHSYLDSVPSSTIPGATEIVFVESTYIPLFDVLDPRGFDITALYLVPYIGLFLLAIWLIWGKSSCLIRHQWSKWQLHSAYGDRQLRHCIRCGEQQQREI